MSKYEKPQITIIEIDVEDIITTSGDPDIDGGKTLFDNNWIDMLS